MSWPAWLLNTTHKVLQTRLKNQSTWCDSKSLANTSDLPGYSAPLTKSYRSIWPTKLLCATHKIQPTHLNCQAIRCDSQSSTNTSDLPGYSVWLRKFNQYIWTAGYSVWLAKFNQHSWSAWLFGATHKLQRTHLNWLLGATHYVQRTLNYQTIRCYSQVQPPTHLISLAIRCDWTSTNTSELATQCNSQCSTNTSELPGYLVRLTKFNQHVSCLAIRCNLQSSTHEQICKCIF